MPHFQFLEWGFKNLLCSPYNYTLQWASFFFMLFPCISTLTPLPSHHSCLYCLSFYLVYSIFPIFQFFFSLFPILSVLSHLICCWHLGFHISFWLRVAIRSIRASIIFLAFVPLPITNVVASVQIFGFYL